MDVCPITFETRAVLLPDAPPCGAFWSYDDPAFLVCLSFFEDMDTSVKPPKQFFDIQVDGDWHTVGGLAWLTNRCLGFSYSEAALTPSVVRIRFPAPHPLLRTALLVPHGTFDVAGFEFVPEAEYNYATPNLTVEITFPVPMDQTRTPDTDEMIIYDNNVPKEPDNIQWSSATVLELTYQEGGLTEDVDVELPSATNNLRCFAEIVVCPFRIDGLGPI